MNREIKFRVWDGKKMILPPSPYSSQAGSNFFTLDGRCYIEGKLQDLVLMQFTGLLDRTGNEIYEGDIVQFTYWWFDGNVAESNLTGAIVYCDALMSFQLKGVKNKEWERFTGHENDDDYLTPFSELNFDEADFEVIGNIYERGDSE